MKELLKKLAAAKEEIKPIEKNLKNPFHKNEYADINQILKQVEPVLAAHKLMLLQPIENGSVVSRVFDLDSGDSVQSSLELPPIDDPQKKGAAITYYRRHTLSALLSLNSGDDDGEETRINDLNPRHSNWQIAYDHVQGSDNIEEAIRQVKSKYSLTKDNETLLKKKDG